MTTPTHPAAGDTCGCCAGVAVSTPLPAGNPPGQPRLAYRTGRHGDFVASMLARLSSPAYPALAGLTVRTPDDPALSLIDGWAVVADLLTFYNEQIANEGYLGTASEERSLRLLGRLVGHQPRPGVAAGTYLAYTVDRDPRTGQDAVVIVPRGARAQSVPGPGEDAQAYETAEDLPARWSFNDLRVRTRQPYQVRLTDGVEPRTVHLAGSANNVRPGDRLLFVFGTEPGRQRLDVVRGATIDQTQGVTAVELTGPPLSTFAELAAEFRQLVEQAQAAEMHRRSAIVRRYVRDALVPIADRLPPAPEDAVAGEPIGTPTEFGLALGEALARLAETIAVATPYPNVLAWLRDWLAPLLTDLRTRVDRLEPAQDRPEPASLFAALGLDRAADVRSAAGSAADGPGGTPPAFAALGALLGALRKAPSAAPRSARDLARDPQVIFGPGSDEGARLLAALDPRLGALYDAWRNVDVTAPLALADLQAMRVVATPFGATAPRQPVYDDRGRVTGFVEWPLTGDRAFTMRVSYADDGAPRSLVLTYVESGVPATAAVDLPFTAELPLGSGTVRITVIDPPPPPEDQPAGRPRRRGRAAQAAEPQPGVEIRLLGQLPRAVIFASRPDDDDVVHVRVGEGEQPLTIELDPGEVEENQRFGEFTVDAQRAPAADDPLVAVTLTTEGAPVSQNVLALDAVYPGIGPGSWVVVNRPRKTALSTVYTRVTQARVISRTDFGTTGKVTELTLQDNWLDDDDTLLADIRDATVYAAGEGLALATEPVTDPVEGAVVELAQLYEGLEPGRWVVVTGERLDVPETAGVIGTELTMIAGVTQGVDPARPGDTVHTTITLSSPLAFRYRRDTVHIYGNVVPATQGASRDEPIGSGDAGQTHQRFRLFQSPLTWLPADNPSGARSTLEVRVDGVRWSEVDSLAGRGPAERVYVTSTDTDGATVVTFGDGVHGARLPTGNENVRARYRVGIGAVGNVGPGQITTLLTRPLGVTAVTNPLPATGGANPDDASQARRTIPLTVTALDRLVGVDDYATFARARAGIGRASARRLFDGRREVVHVTVAGVDDVPLEENSELVRTLRSALSAYGDAQLPVAVATREPVLLVISASVRVTPDRSWGLVEPAVRAALLDRLGFARRELGQPAHLSEVFAAAQAVPGVEHVDVDVFAGVPGSVTPAELPNLAAALTEPAAVVPARLARFDETRYTVTPEPGSDTETLLAVAARNGISVAELLRLNPDLSSSAPLPAGRSVVVFRGIRPAQLALLSAALPNTLILKEATA